MRIIGGTHRGRALASVGKGDVAAHLRPTSDRVRESLFNVLAGGYGDPCCAARVLDMFAGTGALGLESLSRGAEFVGFIENGRKAQTLLAQNISLCRAEGQTKVYRNDVRQLGQNPTAAFDLVFLDPPYGKGLGEEAMKMAIEGGWVSDNALIIWEENTPIDMPDGLHLIEARKYGGTVISFFER
jgi:16S rRNA (guanine966-N2)-methyltransferase